MFVLGYLAIGPVDFMSFSSNTISSFPSVFSNASVLAAEFAAHPVANNQINEKRIIFLIKFMTIPLFFKELF